MESYSPIIQSLVFIMVHYNLLFIMIYDGIEVAKPLAPELEITS